MQEKSNFKNFNSNKLLDEKPLTNLNVSLLVFFYAGRVHDQAYSMLLQMSWQSRSHSSIVISSIIISLMTRTHLQPFLGGRYEYVK